MNKLDKIREEDSCLNRADDNEPLFVLRAKDELAVPTVFAWVREATTRGIHGDRLDEAQALAGKMVNWRIKNGLNYAPAPFDIESGERVPDAVDLELQSIDACVRALCVLSEDEQRRALDYLASRFVGEEP